MLEAIFFGILQGLTEFLPISSTAHVRIFAEFFGMAEDPGAMFTAIMQIGTELAVLIYFRKDIARIISAWFRKVILRRDLHIEEAADARMGWLIILGSLPIVILGYLGQDAISTNFRSLWLIATVLIVFGIILGVADKYGKSDKGLKDLSISHGIFYGLAQAMALVPGVSRSGATIAMGRLLGYNREAALRYSFLLAIPAVFGSGLFQLKKAVSDDSGQQVFSLSETLVATIVAFIVGYLVIAWLIKFVTTKSFMPFIIYRIILGALVLVLLATGVIKDSAKAIEVAPVKPISYSVPKDCLSTDVLAALQKDVRQAQFIDTPWQPAPGTELADFLNNGGIACSYGIQSAEVGISVNWVANGNSMFSNRVPGWISEGYEKIDIPNLMESEAYFFQKDQSSTNEFSQYQVKFLINGFWINLSSSFGKTIEDSSGWILAAVTSLEK
ncbi:MAG: undecaprenyl-diphosphate phosphatase [Actinobacteria bacterium]|uniref:Undecaprenyl-diphosphatase n=1 Tax=freshwater metagenome TaxID=449393 RepID=A0A6J7JZC3_9ZZZZ|nr:undecaprenyl-diphosphate phosphatase [Actinomycetota bacterium]MSZ01948.1 undecaprenyl-diphosphate phosphatase [Actinomycetota bacterium]